MRRFLPLLLLGLTISLLALAFWPKRGGPARPAELEPFQFANTLPTLQPPLAALQPKILDDAVLRSAARIEWGPPDVMYWTCRHLPADRTRLAALLMERYEPVRAGSPLLAQRLIDALGEVRDASSISFLMRVAELAPTEEVHLQLAAIRALAKFPHDDRIAELFERLTADPRPQIAATALQEVVRSDEFATADALNGLLAQYDRGEVIPVLQEVGRRRLAACAEAVLRHLDSPARRIRQNAIYALLASGDPRGLAEVERELDSGDESRVLDAVTLFRDAAVLPPPERSLALLGHRLGDVRRELAVALGTAAGSAPDPGVDALLTRLAADVDPVVARVAAEQLFRRGRADALQSWRDQVATGRGSALREAITFLCEIVRDPAVAPLLRRRLDHEELTGDEQGNLLAGLRFFGDPTDTKRYLLRIRAAGTADDRRAGERTWLSDLAATHVQALGPAAGSLLAEALATAPTGRALLAMLDALRGMLKGMPSGDQQRTAERLFALIADPRVPLAIRREAIDTIAFFDDATLGDRLYALRTTLDQHELATRITQLYASFF